MIHVTRSYPAPSSLATEKAKPNGIYNKPDVVERLIKDFNRKCYLCGIGELADIEVEHLNPHHNGRDVDLKFDWDNLFLSCPHCNGIKNQRKYDNQIIDSCKENPESFLEFGCIDGSVTIRAIVPTYDKAVSTAELLTEVFNRKNTGIRIYTCEMRVQALLAEMNTLYVVLATYQAKPENKVILRKLKGLLNKSSVFSAFKRSYVRHNKERYPELIQFLR